MTTPTIPEPDTTFARRVLAAELRCAAGKFVGPCTLTALSDAVDHATGGRGDATDEVLAQIAQFAHTTPDALGAWLEAQTSPAAVQELLREDARQVTG